MSDRAAAAVVAVTLPACAVVAGGPGLAVPAAVLAVVAVVVATRRIPRFWRSTGRWLASGAAAGLLVLGPGYRLAMRVAALLDADVEPAFSWDGTGLIVVGIGVVVGGLSAAWTSLVAYALGLARRGRVVLLTVVVLLAVLADSEIIGELVGLGGGLWVNLPMFLGATVAFALLSVQWGSPATDDRSTDAVAHHATDPAMMVGGRAERSA